jgi:hypothetical protein
LLQIFPTKHPPTYHDGGTSCDRGHQRQRDGKYSSQDWLDASGKSRRIDKFNSARYHACTFLYQRFVAELADSHA